MSDRADSLRVDFGVRSYDIVISDGAIAEAGPAIAERLGKRKCWIVTDENVAALHLSALRDSLAAAGLTSSEIVLPPGEETKSFATIERVTGEVLDGAPERSSVLIALGGGVIGDVTGFAASAILRGINYVQVPTTLLAQVDSSVGGKTGINTPHGKNMIGAFYQPRLVLADIGALRTLPRRELLAGYAEVVKYGLIRDTAFFEWLEANGAAALDGDGDRLRHAVRTSCEAKAAIVAEDEREDGVRALLNFGHTFGHALEAETGFGAELLHGEAVAIGMIMAFELSVALGLCPEADLRRVRRHFEATGLPRTLPAGQRRWDASTLLGHMSHDKKVRDGRVTFILARRIGDAFIARDVEPGHVRRLLERAAA